MSASPFGRNRTTAADRDERKLWLPVPAPIVARLSRVREVPGTGFSPDKLPQLHIFACADAVRYAQVTPANGRSLLITGQ
jgi:Catalase